MLKIYIYWHKCWCYRCGTGQVKIGLLSFWSVNRWVSQFNKVNKIIQAKDSIPWVRCASGNVCLLPTKTVWAGIFLWHLLYSDFRFLQAGSNHSRGFPASSGKAPVASRRASIEKCPAARFLQGISVPPASPEENTHTLLRMLSFGAGLWMLTLA